MTQEEKAKRYDEAIKRIENIKTGKCEITFMFTEDLFEYIFPELAESEDERIRKAIFGMVYDSDNELWSSYDVSKSDVLAWLENQSQETSWKPSKEEMDALYGLAYITNNMDDKKVEAITKLYQDLKREFFNGVSYENMFPSSPVDAPIKLVEQKPIPKFKIGDTMRTLQEAKYGWTDGMPFIVSIDSEHYNCNSEKIAIKDQDEYEYPPMNRKHDVCDTCDEKASCVNLCPMKLVEKKPIDKVEQKFKIGDWIICCDYEPIQIIDIKHRMYYWSNGDTRPIEMVDSNSNIHLWTIQDAKAGDVLVCIGKYGQEIGIIKEYVGKYGGCDKCFETYCFVDWDGIFRTCEYMGSKEIHPATKEQRDLLFQKMKEAGYEWDVEKNELKKVEQKFDNDLPKGEDYGIDGLWHAERILEKTLGEVEGYQSDDGILEHKCAISSIKELKKMKQQNWSEEDVAMLDSAIAFVEHSAFTTIGKGKNNVIAWLKSIRDKSQPQPQQNQEWSEEDDRMYSRIVSFIPQHLTAESYTACINWLKSLRPQNVWISVDEEVYVKEPVLAQMKDKSDPFGGFVVCCDHTLNPNVYERYIRLDNNCSQNILKPSNWSEEDNKKLEQLTGWLYGHVGVLNGGQKKYAEWLSSLKDKTIPQPKQEWSEDDIKEFKTELQSLMFEWSNKKDNMGVCIDRHIDKLLSILCNHTQSQWKPSEEQMKALALAMEKGIPWYQKEIALLYEQLKKLREE